MEVSAPGPLLQTPFSNRSQQAQPRKAVLVERKRNGTSVTHNIVTKLVIGRDKGCNVRIISKDVSREHGTLVADEVTGQVQLQQLGAIPMTVNDIELSLNESRSISAGDIIKVKVGGEMRVMELQANSDGTPRKGKGVGRTPLADVIPNMPLLSTVGKTQLRLAAAKLPGSAQEITEDDDEDNLPLSSLSSKKTVQKSVQLPAAEQPVSRSPDLSQPFLEDILTGYLSSGENPVINIPADNGKSTAAEDGVEAQDAATPAAPESLGTANIQPTPLAKDPCSGPVETPRLETPAPGNSQLRSALKNKAPPSPHMDTPAPWNVAKRPRVAPYAQARQIGGLSGQRLARPMSRGSKILAASTAAAAAAAASNTSNKGTPQASMKAPKLPPSHSRPKSSPDADTQAESDAFLPTPSAPLFGRVGTPVIRPSALSTPRSEVKSTKRVRFSLDGVEPVANAPSVGAPTPPCDAPSPVMCLNPFFSVSSPTYEPVLSEQGNLPSPPLPSPETPGVELTASNSADPQLASFNSVAQKLAQIASVSKAEGSPPPKAGASSPPPCPQPDVHQDPTAETPVQELVAMVDMACGTTPAQATAPAPSSTTTRVRAAARQASRQAKLMEAQLRRTAANAIQLKKRLQKAKAALKHERILRAALETKLQNGAEEQEARGESQSCQPFAVEATTSPIKFPVVHRAMCTSPGPVMAETACATTPLKTAEAANNTVPPAVVDARAGTSPAGPTDPVGLGTATVRLADSGTACMTPPPAIPIAHASAATSPYAALVEAGCSPLQGLTPQPDKGVGTGTDPLPVLVDGSRAAITPLAAPVMVNAEAGGSPSTGMAEVPSQHQEMSPTGSMSENCAEAEKPAEAAQPDEQADCAMPTSCVGQGDVANAPSAVQNGDAELRSNLSPSDANSDGTESKPSPEPSAEAPRRSSILSADSHPRTSRGLKCSRRSAAMLAAAQGRSPDKLAVGMRSSMGAATTQSGSALTPAPVLGPPPKPRRRSRGAAIAALAASKSSSLAVSPVSIAQILPKDQQSTMKPAGADPAAEVASSKKAIGTSPVPGVPADAQGPSSRDLMGEMSACDADVQGQEESARVDADGQDCSQRGEAPIAEAAYESDSQVISESLGSKGQKCGRGRGRPRKQPVVPEVLEASLADEPQATTPSLRRSERRRN